MLLKNSAIFNAKEPLQKLIELKLPVKVSYALARTASKLNEQLKIIEEVRQSLFKKHGEQTDKGWEIKANSPNLPMFLAEIEELLAQEVELDIQKVALPSNGADLNIEPVVLMALDWLVEVV